MGRVLRWPLRLIPRDARLPVLQGPLRGMRWIAGAGNHSCWLGCYESNKQKELQQRIRPGDVVYDLGAHAGYFSLVAAVLTGPEGRVISFEPLPQNVAFLRRHLDLNEIRNCTVVEAAVASYEGTGRFHVVADRSMGRLCLDENAPVSAHIADIDTHIAVPVVTIDGMVARGEIPPPVVMKCDVEGADLDALRGAERVLRTYHPAILLDQDSDEGQAACCAFLSDLGYQITPLDGLPLRDSMVTRSVADSTEVLAIWGK